MVDVGKTCSHWVVGPSGNRRRRFAVNSFRGFIVKGVQRDGAEVGGRCGVKKVVCHVS